MADETSYRYSINTFDGDGATVNWEVSFDGGYINKDHVSAQLLNTVTGGVSDALFTWVNDFTIKVTPAVPVGTRLVVRRNTPIGEPLVDYSDGAIMAEANLDLANKQAIFAISEMRDAFGSITETGAVETALSLVQAATEAAEIAAQAASAAAGNAVATRYEFPAAEAGQIEFVMPVTPPVRPRLIRNGAEQRTTSYSWSGNTIIVSPCVAGELLTAIIAEDVLAPYQSQVDLAEQISDFSDEIADLSAEVSELATSVGQLIYGSRAAFVADVATGAFDSLADGVVITVGGYQYRKASTANALPGLPGWHAVKPSFAHFGGDLTGTNDVAPQINACLLTYKECYIPDDGVKHKITTVLGNGWIRGVPGKSFLKMVGTDIPIKFYGSLGTANAFSSLAGPGTREITVFSSTADLAAKQFMVTEADRPPILNMSAQGTGEIVQIETVTGPAIKFIQALRGDYSSGVARNLRRVNWATDCGMEGVNLEGRLDVSVTPTITGLPMVEFRFCQNGIVRNCELHSHRYAAVNAICSHSCKVSGNYIHDLETADDDVNGGFGYGFQEQANNLGNVMFGNTLERCRTGYTTSGGDSQTYRYGIPVNTNVIGNTMSSMLQSGCSTHEAGRYITFAGNTINGCRAMGINMRCQGHVVTGNTITNTTGAGIVVVSSPRGDIQDTVIKGNTLIHTNQGVIPQGGDARNEGAIYSNSPHVVLVEDNTIMYPGGPGIQLNYAKRGVIKDNTIVNPCQADAGTSKWAIGSSQPGSVGNYVIIGQNTVLSNDGKMTAILNKQTNLTFHDAGGNFSPDGTFNF